MSNQFSSLAEKRRVNQATKPRHIATAFLAIAKVNHYMVGFVGFDFSCQDMRDAEQILISQSNLENNQNPDTELALNLINYELIRTCKGVDNG